MQDGWLFEFRPRFEVPVTVAEADVRYAADRAALLVS